MQFSSNILIRLSQRGDDHDMKFIQGTQSINCVENVNDYIISNVKDYKKKDMESTE